MQRVTAWLELELPLEPAFVAVHFECRPAWQVVYRLRGDGTCATIEKSDREKGGI